MPTNSIHPDVMSNTHTEEIFGLVASFKTPSATMHAAQQVRDAGFTHWDVHTPFPVHGMDKAMGLKRSKLPRCTFIGGLTGCLTGLLLVWYINGYDYPLIVGGKPFFSPIFPIPVFYELTILFAAFGTFFGMFLMNRLPQHYHSVFNHPAFNRATDDTFFIVIEQEDPKFDLNKTKQLLIDAKAEGIETLHK